MGGSTAIQRVIDSGSDKATGRDSGECAEVSEARGRCTGRDKHGEGKILSGFGPLGLHVSCLPPLCPGRPPVMKVACVR